MAEARILSKPLRKLEKSTFVCFGILLRTLCSSCPPPCHCPRHDNATLCRHRLLSLVPPEIPLASHFLDLSYNRIRSIQPKIFGDLQELQELDLSHNQLSRMEPGVFSGLPSLRILLVHHNQLKLLPSGVFAGMPDLTWLDVRGNQLVILLDQTFQGLRELRHLEAGDNPLLFISSGAFLGMPQLQRLGLEETKLGNVPSKALSALPKLSDLRLGGVNCPVLRDFSFTGLIRLRVLDMDNWPSLRTLEPLSLSGLNLTSLSLTRSNLSSVPEEALRTQVHLRRLDLSRNPIYDLHVRSLHVLKRLEELRLSDGRLTSIPSATFHGLVHLRILDLSNNPLHWIAEDALPPSPGYMETLLLSGTMLSCDCRLCWLLGHRLDFGSRPPVCAAPDSLRGMVIPDHPELLCPELFKCQPPRIVEPEPRELTVQEGDRLTIRCHSNGVPEPFTHWVSPIAVPALERVTVLPEGSLQFWPVQVSDTGAYLCLASNLAGNDSAWLHLEVTPFNESTMPPSFPMVYTHLLVVITAGGLLPFIISVTICFIFMLLWSRGRGNIKHTANIDFVPRTTRGTSDTEDNKFTMKLI
uniref:Ig-like domain-containing protein n=1 Tax=Leptobrachium leishanense TaxID=445787 RepID=A0A8C5PXN2_9ANUR